MKSHNNQIRGRHHNHVPTGRSKQISKWISTHDNGPQIRIQLTSANVYYYAYSIGLLLTSFRRHDDDFGADGVGVSEVARVAPDRAHLERVRCGHAQPGDAGAVRAPAPRHRTRRRWGLASAGFFII